MSGWRCFSDSARGEATPASDLDLALWARPEPAPETRLEWARELAEALGAEVQLVVIAPILDPVPGMQIAREGKTLFEERPGRALEERLRLWHLLQDSRPFLELARGELGRFAAEVRDGA